MADDTGEFIRDLNDCLRSTSTENSSRLIAMIASTRHAQKDMEARLRAVEGFTVDYRATSSATAVQIGQQTDILRTISASIVDVRDRLARLEGEKTGQFLVQRVSSRPKEQPALQITVGRAAQIGGLGASLGGVIVWLLQRF
jgi:hypothetical protein